MKVLLTMDPGYRDQGHVFPFAKSLLTYLHSKGIAATDTPDTGETIAVCVQWNPPLPVVQDLHRRGVKIIHRLDGRARALVKNYDSDDDNRAINALADWTVFQSRYVLEHTTTPCSTIFGLEPPICLTPERGSIIYNGVDRTVFNDIGPREPLKAKFNIIHVAFTHGIRKGVSDLVQVASLLRNNPDIHFYTIGRQDQDVAHGHLLADLPNVTHLGVIVDRARLATLMRSAQCLFFPSRDDYCPNTVIEAMSCGLPVWFHPSGGTPELVIADGLVAGVAMIEQNPIYPLFVIRENHAEFSRRAVELVQHRFTLEHMGDAYLELFRRLLAQPSAPPLRLSA